ncbi:hypothetical protein PTW37_12015 [Arthrobacter agilis]|nr:hypothetical protein [Arthrobacter agilis]WDF32579.1 hypothetical protein PTW37_12015 [Arthrobacter agilis]
MSLTHHAASSSVTYREVVSCRTTCSSPTGSAARYLTLGACVK